MAITDRMVVLVHGWSVASTDAYGQLADRLEVEAKGSSGLALDVRNIWLSKYVSFNDDVRVEDLSRAFEAAIRRELGSAIDKGRRIVFITHSTGGPVVRDWWDRYYVNHTPKRICPMSHLIMLAPPNFGSALAQLGKSRLGKIKTWFQGVEPGAKVLDWLELGSQEAWDLNRRWFEYPIVTSGRNPVFMFTLTGQSIDRRLYDQLNSYTGELGSDGVVRAASANLNATYVRLEQERPREVAGGNRPKYEAPDLKQAVRLRSQRTAFALLPGMAHSGARMGILRGIRSADGRGQTPHATVAAILKCLAVETQAQYLALCEDFDAQTRAVEVQELVEKEETVLHDRWFIHDPCSMIIFRVVDQKGFEPEAFDLRLTAGVEGDPNLLPEGFFKDRQANLKRRANLTYFLNTALMRGSKEVPGLGGELLRPERSGAEFLGLEVAPHQQTGLVHYLMGELRASTKTLSGFVRPHETTMVEVVLQRVVREAVYRLTTERNARDFKREPEGPAME